MERGTHILVIAYPVQGHINPMLQFSKRLASKGPRVTFISTSIMSKSILQTVQTAGSSLNFETISDGSEDVDHKTEIIDAQLERFELVVSQNLAKFIESQKSSKHPPKILVYDSVLPWALNVARKLGIDGAPFFTQSCAVNAIYYHHVLRGALGRIPVEGPLISLPSMPSLGISDMPSFLCDTHSYPALLKLVLNQFSNFQEANWLFCNTFDKLEHELSLRGYEGKRN
ncbi:mogroside IE synthase-like isoform X2 [Juglans microcarpa x Juglans regia]|uniref:mogroside IE synthase-like isoform X2 n=1 Tax=Juglans microcarpa x Juglans regia TaxID=2249226 RepID=UPI001B7DDCFF|nr:mogroside IE synthase-like isoform X2 [Juglans microcarpa x Juglans regia]